MSLPNGLIFGAMSPCMVMIKTKGKTIEKIEVSDPSRNLKSIELMVNFRVKSSSEYWKSEWIEKKKLSVMSIDLPVEDYAGKTVELILTQPTSPANNH
jgi:hypothetical protein